MKKVAGIVGLLILIFGIMFFGINVFAQPAAHDSNSTTVDLDTSSGQVSWAAASPDIQRFVRPSDQAASIIDNAYLTLPSKTELTFTPTYSTYVPIAMKSCLIGESNNIADALTTYSGWTVCGQVDDIDWDDVYKIQTVADQQLTISMTGTGVGGPGDADLYLYPPGTADANTDPPSAVSNSGSNNEFLQGTVLVGGFWYIDVFDCCESDGGTNYNLTVTLSGPGPRGVKTFNLTDADRLRAFGRSKTPD